MKLEFLKHLDHLSLLSALFYDKLFENNIHTLLACTILLKKCNKLLKNLWISCEIYLLLVYISHTLSLNIMSLDILWKKGGRHCLNTSTHFNKLVISHLFKAEISHHFFIGLHKLFYGQKACKNWQSWLLKPTSFRL